MTCDYCGARNSHGDERCRRCGRRATGSRTGEFQVTGALATKMQPVAGSAPVEMPASRSLENAVQPRLFYERPAPNVIPFEAFAPPPARQPSQRKRSSGSKTQSTTGTGIQTKPVGKASKSGSRRGSAPDTQGKLDFLQPVSPKPRTLGTTVEAVIYCEAPVATPLHRALAAAADWSMVFIAYGMFLATYRILGGAFVMNKLGLLMLCGALPLIGFTYGLIFAVARTETAGMRWMHLNVVTFDGDRPNGKEWLLRLLGACLSHCTGLGLLWVFADEESLTWQDHISSTFPTPVESGNHVLVRR